MLEFLELIARIETYVFSLSLFTSELQPSYPKGRLLLGYLQRRDASPAAAVVRFIPYLGKFYVFLSKKCRW